GGAEQDREQFLNAGAGEPGNAHNGTRMDFETVNDEAVGSSQAVDAQRTDLDRRHRVLSASLFANALRTLDNGFRRFAEHGGDHSLECSGGGRDIFRNALAVAQNDEVVGNIEQFFEEMADINDADAGIAQAANDIVQPLHLGDMQRRGRLVENKNP